MIKQLLSIFCLLLIFIPYSLSAAAGTGKEYSLDDLYMLALERSETIKVAEEDLYISERGKDKALATLFPKLSAFGTYTRYSEEKQRVGFTIQSETTNTWGFRIDQSFSVSGRELTAFKISKESIEKSRYDLHTVKGNYLLDVASAYYDVLRSKKALDIADANIERLTKHRDAAEIRLKVGEVTKTVLLRAEAELSGAQSELIRARNNLRLAKAVLARIVGLEGDYKLIETVYPVRKKALSELSNKVNSEGIGTIESLKQIALSERFELKSLELQKRIAEDEVRYAKGLYWPTLSVEGVYLREKNEPSSSFVIEERIYGGLRLDFPFFEGGLRRAEVREAKAKQRRSELIYEDLKKTIGIEVENAYLDFMTQRGVLKSFHDQLTFAKDNYNAVSKQFEFGIVDSIDVMDANTLLVTAEREFANAGYDCQLAILVLKRATGTLLKTVINEHR